MLKRQSQLEGHSNLEFHLARNGVPAYRRTIYPPFLEAAGPIGCSPGGALVGVTRVHGIWETLISGMWTVRRELRYAPQAQQTWFVICGK